MALTSGGFQFSLNGQTYRAYTIETVTNLLSLTWSNRLTVTLTNSPQPLTDPLATNGRPSYYRARLLP